MRSLRFALPALLLFASATAHAQQPPPLMTAPRPDDKATTDPVTSDQGVSGAAPSNEMQQVATTGRPLSTAEAKALVGKSARTRDGQTAGEIRDFVLAGPDGRVDRIVLSSGGVLGIGASMVSVPASALRVGAAHKVAEPGEKPPMDVTLDLTSADVAQAPSFAYDSSAQTLIGGK